MLERILWISFSRCCFLFSVSSFSSVFITTVSSMLQMCLFVDIDLWTNVQMKVSSMSSCEHTSQWSQQKTYSTSSDKSILLTFFHSNQKFLVSFVSRVKLLSWNPWLRFLLRLRESFETPSETSEIIKRRFSLAHNLTNIQIKHTNIIIVIIIIHLSNSSFSDFLSSCIEWYQFKATISLEQNSIWPNDLWKRISLVICPMIVVKFLNWSTPRVRYSSYIHYITLVIIFLLNWRKWFFWMKHAESWENVQSTFFGQCSQTRDSCQSSVSTHCIGLQSTGACSTVLFESSQYFLSLFLFVFTFCHILISIVLFVFRHLPSFVMWKADVKDLWHGSIRTFTFLCCDSGTWISHPKFRFSIFSLVHSFSLHVISCPLSLFFINSLTLLVFRLKIGYSVRFSAKKDPKKQHKLSLITLPC